MWIFWYQAPEGGAWGIAERVRYLVSNLSPPFSSFLPFIIYIMVKKKKRTPLAYYTLDVPIYIHDW